MTRKLASARIVVVDDCEPFRKLLVEYLATEDRLDVVGFAADGVEAEHVIDLTDPDVVVLDAHLPRESGLEVLEKMRETHPDTMFVVSSSDDTTAPEADRLGADLYFDKIDSIDELCDAIRERVHRR